MIMAENLSDTTAQQELTEELMATRLMSNLGPPVDVGAQQKLMRTS